MYYKILLSYDKNFMFGTCFKQGCGTEKFEDGPGSEIFSEDGSGSISSSGSNFSQTDINNHFLN
jgi:hypothetical protein